VAGATSSEDFLVFDMFSLRGLTAEQAVYSAIAFIFFFILTVPLETVISVHQMDLHQTFRIDV